VNDHEGVSVGGNGCFGIGLRMTAEVRAPERYGWPQQYPGNLKGTKSGSLSWESGPESGPHEQLKVELG
jgi:hypothetical protein